MCSPPSAQQWVPTRVLHDAHNTDPAALISSKEDITKMLQLTVWVAAIILQSALLGRNMYAVSCVSVHSAFH